MYVKTISPPLFLVIVFGKEIWGEGKGEGTGRGEGVEPGIGMQNEKK